MLNKLLINCKFISKITLLFFLIFSSSLADIIKPNGSIEPKEVVKIQLSALMKNDLPNKDNGIIQTWEFAHPNNQRVTGPIDRFKKMLKTASYSMLLNHSNHEVLEIYKSSKLATFEVTVLDKEKKYYKFKWQVEKYAGEGDLKDCWLTTAVSQPIPLGSSV
tara:strand:+ start:53 stop:538 length:486 start_codon:yes stop_codon:yes gene_type:complete